jgi:hypothetical protein
VLLCILGSAGQSFALPPCPTSGVFDNCQGIWTNPDGYKYVGEWKEHTFHGHSTYTSPDGSKYVGEFKDGLGMAKVASYISDGETYVGEFKDNEPHHEEVVKTDAASDKDDKQYEVGGYDEEDLEEFLDTGDCVRCDLTNLDFGKHGQIKDFIYPMVLSEQI